MPISFEEVYPDASEEELQEARERIDAYVRFLVRRHLQQTRGEVDDPSLHPYDEGGRPNYQS